MTFVRISSLLDGVSYLVLLLVAMPLKYVKGIPEAVSVVGGLHGAFFVALCVAIALAVSSKRFPLKWGAIVFGCALIPFAPFWLDRRLRERSWSK